MFDYQLFGGVLRSEIEFPELPSAPGAHGARWTLERGAVPPLAAAELLGTDQVNSAARVHLYRTAAGFRLLFDDTGAFDISADGSRITWDSPAGVSLRDARADLTSRVLAAALYAAGSLCLHGSAVTVGGHAIGLVAPKRHGKSTLALALVRSGARLLTDDTLPIDLGDPVIAHPGLHATRLWADSAERVALGSPHEAATGEKVLFSNLPAESVTHESAPLGAIYLISPTQGLDDGAPARRTPVSAVESALVLIGNAKLGPLLGKSELPALFRAGAELARRVPVYRLEVVRDLNRLEEVVDLVECWHGEVARGAELALT